MQFITKKEYSNIRVINKVNSNDKKYFANVDAFNKYFTINSSEAFASCFYYFHFNNLLLNDNKNTNDINNQVKDDYKQFNETKNDINKTINKDRYKWIFGIIFVITIIGFLIQLYRIINQFRYSIKFYKYHFMNEGSVANQDGMVVFNEDKIRKQQQLNLLANMEESKSNGF